MAKAIREADGKALLHRYANTLLAREGQPAFDELQLPSFRCVSVVARDSLDGLSSDHPWLRNEVRSQQGILLSLKTQSEQSV